MRRELERIEITGEHEARDRALAIALAALAAREPSPSRRSWRPIVILATVLALAAAALSPQGLAVLGGVRDAVVRDRVERVRPALFSLPAPGRLLVVSAERGGVWVVRSDGSRRRLADFTDARWSPFGRFVVATRRNQLIALTPDGQERWSLARRDVLDPIWGGSRTDTRIAYLTRSGIRVVDGDGTRDRALAPAEAGPLAWRPGPRHELAYLSASELRLQDVDTGRVLWRSSAVSPSAPLGISWSADGSRVLVAFLRGLLVFDGSGRLLRRVPVPKLDVVAASFGPSARAIGLLLRSRGAVTPRTRNEVRVLDSDRGRGRQVFSGHGDFGELAWSPDGRFILVAWRSADRWLFVNRATRFAIAVEGIASQFPRPDGRPPALLLSGRWCCGR